MTFHLETDSKRPHFAHEGSWSADVVHYAGRPQCESRGLRFLDANEVSNAGEAINEPFGVFFLGVKSGLAETPPCGGKRNKWNESVVEDPWVDL